VVIAILRKLRSRVIIGDISLHPFTNQSIGCHNSPRSSVIC